MMLMMMMIKRVVKKKLCCNRWPSQLVGIASPLNWLMNETCN
jgi:hypothetical protein